MHAPIDPRARGPRTADEARALLVVDVRAVDDLFDAAAAGDDDAHPVALLGVIAAKSMESATASLPAAIAKWMNRLIRRAIFGSMTVDGSKPRTSAAIRTDWRMRRSSRWGACR